MTQQKGFSAIEILVALTVLVILAGEVWVIKSSPPSNSSIKFSTSFVITF